VNSRTAINVAGTTLAHIEIVSQILLAESEKNSKISQNIRPPGRSLTKALLNLG
jgi:hypothetical protein